MKKRLRACPDAFLFHKAITIMGSMLLILIII